MLGRFILNLFNRLIAWLLVGFFGFGWGYITAVKGMDLGTFGSVAAGLVGFVLVVAAFEGWSWHRDRKYWSRVESQVGPKLMGDRNQSFTKSSRT